VARTGIKDGREQGPQKNKWGYVNNPRWQISPMGPLHYESGGEPQVWDPDQKKFVTGEIKVHLPCGHWHKVPIGGWPEGGGGEEGENRVFFGGRILKDDGTGSSMWRSWRIQGCEISNGDIDWEINEYVNAYNKCVWKMDCFENELYSAGENVWGDEIDQFNAWVIEKRDAETGVLIWSIEHNIGGVVDIAVDSTGVYPIGGNWSGDTMFYASRMEKRSRQDGSLTWQVVTAMTPPAGSTGFYQRSVDCALDNDYLYVSSIYLYNYLAKQYQGGIIYTIDKETGNIVDTWYDTLYNNPFPSNRPWDIAVSTKSKTGNGSENVYVMTCKYLRQLNNSWNLNFSSEFKSSTLDYDTIDIGISCSDAGIFIGGQQGSNSYQGYKVELYNYSGVNQWSTIYNENIGSYIGPQFGDLKSLDSDVYIASHLRYHPSTYYYQAYKQKINSNGEIEWTIPDTTTAPDDSHFWAVATTNWV
jgi:hypothetical protein